MDIPFVIDAMAGVAQIVSTEADDLWEFQLPDGRGMHRGMRFILPYIEDKSAWPFRKTSCIGRNGRYGRAFFLLGFTMGMPLSERLEKPRS